ncbi:M20 metallopeptidase family protein [Pseudonocardia spinosispora]|uniref:M20 metallopeptidase family protein n=1 Tax=Pseudonocardia spinosispora TaxID=103441 RepID=UPI001FDEB48D|nr:M20 family metallopeptidase [Pseudonocardia spinosispora]
MRQVGDELSISGLAGAVSAELPGSIRLRHLLHADPRLSGQEDDTAEAVRSAIGRPAERVAGTGRLIRLGPETGPAVVLRAELDGLPLTEQSGAAFASTSGVMHACGHDTHLAALVAVARALATGPELPCGVLILLQPREEAAPTGAGDVLADPAFVRHDVRAVIGVHVQPALPRGTVSAAPGAVNASCDELTITIRGRGGHAAYPQRADDPVLALAQTVVSLHHIVSRRVDPLDAAVLTVGRLDAGTASNVIPSVARGYATLRALDQGNRERLLRAVRDVVGHTAASYGCTGSLRVVDNEPALHNDPALALAVAPLIAELGLRPDATFRSCGSDDFAHYGTSVPSVMLFVGVDDGTPGAPGLHDARFVPPDDVVGELASAYLAGLVAATAKLDQREPTTSEERQSRG